MLLGEELNLGFWIGALFIGGGLLIAARAEPKKFNRGIDGRGASEEGLNGGK
jgi:drug/metabolite transporter (DMT)-like permease